MRRRYAGPCLPPILAAAVAASSAPRAHADERAPSLFVLNWHAPDECANGRAVEREVLRLLTNTTRGAQPTMEFEATLSKQPTGRYSLTLETTVEQGRFRRTLEASRCDELIKPAATVIALAVDPEATNLSLEPREPPPTDRTAPPPDSAATAAPGPAPHAEPEARATPPPPSDRATPITAGPARDRVRPSPRSSHSIAAYVRASAVADFGALPQPALGPAAAVGVEIGSGALRAEAGFFYLPPQRVALSTSPEQGGDIELVALSLSGCWLPVHEALLLGPCLGLEGGRASGSGFGVRNPASDDLTWFAARAGGLAGYRFEQPLDARLAVLVRADAFVRPSESAFVFEDLGEVHRPSSFGFRADLGLEFRFR